MSGDRAARALELAGLDRLPHELAAKPLAQLLELTGRRAAVTAGGGQGLGRAVVERLAEQGARVAVVHHAIEGAARVAEAASREQGQCVPVVADITTWDGAHQAVAEAAAALGGIDIWVNNLGGGAAGKVFSENSREEIDNAISRALLSTLYCSRAVLDVMLPQGSGRIINISSGAAKIGLPQIAAYSAAKAGVHALTSALAKEVGEHGIQVNCVGPGFMIGNPRIEETIRGERGTTFEPGLSRVTVGRAALAEEVANVVAFLASDAASYVHGAVWMVDGGMADY